MSTTRTRLAIASALLLVTLVCLPLQAANVSLTLLASPDPVSRGKMLVYEISILNEEAAVLANATLYVPLPGGLDQWGAEVRVDGGTWAPYPANGLLPLDDVSAGEGRDIEVRAQVEVGAPGSLPTAAEILGPSGPLADASLDINVLPSVDAGPDLIAEYGGSVALALASAGDGGDGLALIEWSDSGAGGAFDDASSTNPIYTPPQASGISELTLRVVDHEGGEASDSLRVRVNAPPTAVAGADRIMEGSGRANLSDASAADGDGWIVSYRWDDDGAGGSFHPSATILHPEYTPPPGALCSDLNLRLTLTVSDDWGGTGSDSFQLSVLASNALPQVNAGADQEVVAGDRVTLLGEAIDPNENMAGVAWEQLGGPAVDLEPAGTTVWFNAPSVDEETLLRFRMTAFDTCGAEASDEAIVLVRPAYEPGSSALDLSIEVLDSWGIPIDPLQPVPQGSLLTIVIRVTNQSDVSLTDLVGSGMLFEELSFADSALAPWGRERIEVRIPAEPNGDGCLEIRIHVSALAPDGTAIASEAQATILLQGETSASSLLLEKTVDRTSVAVGEDVIYTYKIRNVGDQEAQGILLSDDRLGSIPLPRSSLAPDETMTIHVRYTILESDLPGPLTNVALLTSYAPGAVGVTRMSADVSIELLSSPVGAGGVADASVTGTGSGGLGSARCPVVFSEIAWAGTRADPRSEWIELANISGAPIDLSGWTIRWPSSTALGGWCQIDLAGLIMAMPDGPVGGQRIQAVLEGDGWQLADLSRHASPRGVSPGFYIVERGSDDAIVGVGADQIYDEGFQQGSELSDEGTVLFLHAADGRLVDTANASAVNGWAGGDERTAGTMERVNLFRSDAADNWQTHPGAFAFGLDRQGHPICGSAGGPNAPTADALAMFATTQLESIEVDSARSFPLAGSRDPSMVAFTLVGTAAGGGGSVPTLGSIRRRSEGGTEWLDVNPSGWSGSTLCVWVSDLRGRTYVLVLTPGGEP